jgi:hypothetical protein
VSAALAVYDVFSDRVSAVESALSALNLKGVRKGLPSLAWAWGEPVMVRGAWRTPLALTGDPPAYAGWEFVACLEHVREAGANVVRALPGFAPAPIWRTVSPSCDHCKQRRFRTETYLLRNANGEIYQVGSTCIGDFLGHDRAGQIALAASRLAEVRGMLEDECTNGGASSDRAIVPFVADCAYFVRAVGWLSRSADRTGEATADRVWYATTRTPSTDADRAEAEAAILWASALTEEELSAERGDYLHNLRVIAGKRYLSARDAGLAASLVVAYQRAQARAREAAERAASPASSHVGAIGEKLTWGRAAEVGKRGAPRKGAPTVASLEPVRLDFLTTFETDYGVTTLVKFIDCKGNVLVWFASGQPGVTRADVGTSVTLCGTVKKHATREGVEQTILTRCDVRKVGA